MIKGWGCLLKSQKRFIKWDWDCVLIDEEGKRVEADMREAVKKRVQETYWDERTTGQTWDAWHSMGEQQKELMTNIMKTNK